MGKSLTKFNLGNMIKTVKDGLSSRYLPFLTAAVVLICYYCSMEMVTIYYIALTGMLTVILCDDLSPLFSNFLFMNIMISRAHSPSSTLDSSNYFLQPVIYVQLIVLIAMYALAIIYRIAKTATKHKFKPTPVFFGLAAFALALVLNGVFSTNMSVNNLVFGAFLAFLFLVIFTLIKDNISCDKKTFINISYTFLAFSITLIIELAVAYLIIDGLLTGGTVARAKLMFGWGIYNTMGMLLLLCIPPIMYLAAKSKLGYLLFIYSLVLLGAVFLSMSRQAMVGAVIIYPVCLIILLVKGGYRTVNLIILGIVAAFAFIFACVFWDKIYKLFENIIFNGDKSNGRFDLWNSAMESFSEAPIFGFGFYDGKIFDPAFDFDGLSLVPNMYHNTYMQLLGSCGLFGCIAYVVHRIQTIASFCKRITQERTMLVLSIGVILILNLFDNHLFYLLPTLVYSALTALLVKSEKQPL